MSNGGAPHQGKPGLSHLVVQGAGAGAGQGRGVGVGGGQGHGSVARGPSWVVGGSSGSVALADSAELAERVQVIKNGVDPGKVEMLASRLGWPKERLLGTLGLARATIDRRIRDNKSLSPEEGSRVLGLERLIDQVQRMVEESGDPVGFDAGAWVGQWLSEPVPALGGKPPAEYMDTSEGQQLVATIVAQIQSGAYS